MKTLLRQFKLIQIKYQQPDIWAKMAERTESEIDANEDTVYHDVENNELSMLLRVNQTGGRVLPAGSFTERAVTQLVQRTTGVHPTSLTLLGLKEVLLDFEKSVSVVDVALVLHNMSNWDRFKVETSCLMAKQDQLVNMFQEKEIAEREKFQLKEEKHHYQQQLGQMVEKIGSQIEQLDRKSIQRHPCYLLELSHLLWGVPVRMCNNWLWFLDCLCFRVPNPRHATKELTNNGSSK